MQGPKQIDITFTEEDRCNAGQYTDGHNCLVATALKRLGHQEIHCYLFTHHIGGLVYTSPDTSSSSLHSIPTNMVPHNHTGPYYEPEIVGKRITLTLQD